MTNKLKFRVQRDQNQFKIVTKLKKKKPVCTLKCLHMQVVLHVNITFSKKKK